MPRRPCSKNEASVKQLINRLNVPAGTRKSRRGEPRESVTYLRVVFEGSEGAHVALAVDHRDREVGRLNKLQNLRISVHAVVDVVLTDLNEVDDCVAVVGVRAPQNDALAVEVLERLLELLARVVAGLSEVIFLHRVVFEGLQGLFSL